MDCNYEKEGTRGLTLCVRRFLRARRAAGGTGGRIEQEETREREEAGGATVGQGGKETGPYQPKREEKTTENDGEERVDGTGGEK